MSLPIIALVSPGQMGAAIGARLSSAPSPARVLTHIPANRSQGSWDRAKSANMEPVSMNTIAKEADWVLSVLPPASAFDFARELVAAVQALPENERRLNKPAFVDCNAVSPGTMTKLFGPSGINVPCVDASIIGGPPRAGYDPTIYASAALGEDGQKVLDQFETLSKLGLKISVLRGEGAGVGAASALKMSYAGITKGSTGLVTTMVLSAYRNSPGTAHALIQELSYSQPLILGRGTKMIPDMIPKAYRFDGEMDEIAAFVAEGEASKREKGGAPSSGGSVEPSASLIYTGMANLFRSIAGELSNNGQDIEQLKDFVVAAQSVLEEKQKAASK